jgi:hypothetical protein
MEDYGTSNSQKAAPSSTRRSHEATAPFQFFDLPAEMRNMIYEVLLFVGRIFYSTLSKAGSMQNPSQLCSGCASKCTLRSSRCI